MVYYVNKYLYILKKFYLYFNLILMGPKKVKININFKKNQQRERSREKEIDDINKDHENYPYKFVISSTLKVQLENFVQKGIKPK